MEDGYQGTDIAPTTSVNGLKIYSIFESFKPQNFMKGGLACRLLYMSLPCREKTAGRSNALLQFDQDFDFVEFATMLNAERLHARRGWLKN